MRKSAGLLLYRRVDNRLEVLLVHSSGREDLEPWSIPKGEFDPNAESPVRAAIREVREELGITVSEDSLVSLGECVYRNKEKRVFCFSCPVDPQVSVRPDSREIRKHGFFEIDPARTKLHQAQAVFLDRLLDNFHMA